MESNQRKLKVLVLHNYTKGFATGGEAHVFEDEAKLLESNGHVIHRLFISNSHGTEVGIMRKVEYFLKSPWSDYGYKLVKSELKKFKPDIAHAHNFFFIFSPKIFLAFWEEKIPIVVTLHNYRLVVPCSQMIYKGKPCEICLGKNPWRIIFKRCYKNSFFASLFRYRFYYRSQKRHNWWSFIDKFITLSNKGREILVKGGLPANKILVKPNFIHDPRPKENSKGYGALYIGMITEEKGLRELVVEWQEIKYPLKIIGSGPIREELITINKNSDVKLVGLLTREKVMEELGKCAFVVVPSKWHEAFGLVNIEAFSMGKPVIASRKGAMLDIIEDGKNGIFFDISIKGDLKEKVKSLIDDNDLLNQMSVNSRNSYLKHYSPNVNYKKLIDIYYQVLAEYENT